MYSRAILFSLAACYIFLAVLHLRRDWRWYLGRALLLCGLAMLPLACLMTQTHAILCVLGNCVLFLGFGIYPPLLERKLLRSILLKGKVDPRKMLLYRVLTLDRSAGGLRALADAAEVAEIGLSIDTHHRLDEAFVGRSGPFVRSRYLVQVLYRLVRWDRWEDACDVFEEFFPDANEADAEALFLMVRPYAELGRTQRAYQCVVVAEGKGPLYHHQQIERLLAYAVLFALCGQRKALDELFTRHVELVEDLPEGFPPYWRGVADLVRGKADKARRNFARVLEAEAGSPDEAMWQSASARRQDDAVEMKARARVEPLKTDQTDHLLVLDLLALRTKRFRPPEPNLFRMRAGRVTAALILINVTVWLIALALGAGSDDHTLMAMGANMGSMVRASWKNWWMLVSSIFLHDGFLHLLLNCAVFYFFGSYLERRTGSASMFLIYMTAGLAGSVLSATFGGYTASVGASGAIMGLYGASFTLIVRQRRRLPAAVRNFYPVMFGVMAVLTILFDASEASIDHFAHMGGLFAGGFIGLFVPLQAVRAEELDEQGRRHDTLRRPARYFRNALVGLTGVMIIYAGTMATRNVIAGGYPRVIPEMVEYVSGTQPVAITVPRFWYAETAPPVGALIFHDPLEAQFAVAVEPARFAPGSVPVVSQAAVEAHVREVASARAIVAISGVYEFELGGRTFYQYDVIEDPFEPAPEDGPRRSGESHTLEDVIAWFDSSGAEDAPRDRLVLRDVYLTHLNGGVCVMEFRCRLGRHDSYLPLVRRIVGSVRPAVLPLSEPAAE